MLQNWEKNIRTTLSVFPLLTGIVVSRGSNYTSDFIKRLQNPDIGEIVLEDVIGVADDAGKAEAHASGVLPNA